MPADGTTCSGLLAVPRNIENGQTEVFSYEERGRSYVNAFCSADITRCYFYIIKRFKRLGMNGGTTEMNRLPLRRLLLSIALTTLASCSVVDEYYLSELKNALEADYQASCPECEKCEEQTCQPTVCPEFPPCPACPEPVIEPTPPVVEPEPEPVIESPTVWEGFSNGTLWKPASDTDGNAVVLLRAAHSRAFDACYGFKNGEKVKLDCRKWADGRWVPNCFTNGNRQTFRFPFKCDKADAVKVECHLGEDRLIFIKPGANTCERHE